MESKAHKDLKKQAKEWLKNEHGFEPEEIFEEYQSGSYRIDVVGRDGRKSVAVECGKITGCKDHKQKKIEYLKEEFDDYKRFGFIHTEYDRSEKPDLLKELINNDAVTAIQVDEIATKNMKVQRRSSSLQHTIPSDWSDILGLEKGRRTTSTLNYDEERGFHISIWPKGDEPVEDSKGENFASIIARNFSRDTKTLIRELGRTKVHKLVDRLADEIIHREKDGEIVKEPETKLERDYGETKEEIVEALR
ncbi:MAG: hypothetical protein ABEK04_04120, partial [Candidatus Nanohalobium sp.]